MTKHLKPDAVNILQHILDFQIVAKLLLNCLFIAHFQRAVEFLNQTAGVIARCFILPAAIKLVAFSDKTKKFTPLH